MSKSDFIINMQIGERLKELRIQKGVTQNLIAGYLGVDRSTYTKYETGVSQLSYAKMLLLAKYYSVDFNTLLCYDLNTDFMTDNTQVNDKG